MRALGKGPGLAVLLLDAAKGFLPVYVAPLLFPDTNHTTMLQITCCLFVIAGHNWTCWLKFKGGKGVATSSGALLAFLPVPFLCAFGVWVIIFGIWRYVSLASIAAAVAMPIATLFHEKDMTFFIFTAILAAVVIFKHKPNIQRLLAGTENRIGKRDETGGKGAMV
jgi:acyl phosphate:glycerol-3-phosphate acyltransferase